MSLDFVFAELSTADLDFYDYDVTIAGKRGSGKTTLAIELYKNDCCLMDVEEGAKGIGGIYRKVPKSWKELGKIQKEWAKAIKSGVRPPFSVLLFDTQTKLQEMCQKHVLDENGWESFTQGDDGINRWNVLKTEYVNMMSGFRNLGFKIVRVCHGKDKVFKPRGQEQYNQYTADVGATFDYDVLGSVDFVFYLEKVRITDENGNKKEARRLVLQNDMDYDVKCRFPELPDEIIYEEVEDGVKMFYEEWDRAINKKSSTAKQIKTSKDFAKVEVIEEDDEDDIDGFVESSLSEEEMSLDELREHAESVRDALLEEHSKADVIKMLKESLGTASISKCDDVEALEDFINNYTTE